MKSLIFAIFLFFSFQNLQAQTKASSTKTSTIVKNETVEIACGECKFKMEGKGCDLAIRMKGKSYFVDGKSVDDFGDAHDEKHGFCNVIAKAKVSGEIVNGRFKAKTIEILNDKKD